VSCRERKLDLGRVTVFITKKRKMQITYIGTAIGRKFGMQKKITQVQRRKGRGEGKREEGK